MPETFEGPRGGLYRINSNGLKSYDVPAPLVPGQLTGVNAPNAWAKPPRNFRGVGRCPILAHLKYAPAPQPLWAETHET